MLLAFLKSKLQPLHTSSFFTCNVLVWLTWLKETLLNTVACDNQLAHFAHVVLAHAHFGGRPSNSFSFGLTFVSGLSGSLT